MEGAGEWEVVALDPVAWGAGLPGSPVIGFNDTLVHLVSDSGWQVVGWDGCRDGWALI